ncbi:MAG TPA: lipid-A-disaccharide synthase [Chitinophagaceae bacterium]|nr:lipid-A-disaccharide synthase [Chitinophagaceae bacterium]
MKYYIIAGEASGDLHGSNLIKEIKKLDVEADFRAWGGDKMQAMGLNLVKHHKDLAFMGFVEVVRNLPTILKNLKFCKQDILEYAPDALILIDYPGFNLRLVRWAKEKGLKVIFYISPQVWAWKESRVSLIKNYVDKMIVILPFEKAFYKKFDVDVEYVGHPLVKVVEDYKTEATGNELQDKKIIALLPGSRKQEIKRKLPVMLEASKHFPGYEFIVAKAPAITDEYYNMFLSSFKNVTAVAGQTYSILIRSKAALVTSGTATLETALFEVPEVVCYKAGELSYQIAKRLIKLNFISLVNLIMNKEVIKELIQNDLTVKNLTNELQQLLTDEARQLQIKNDYRDLKHLLSLGGNASANAAKIIYEFLNR